MDSVILYSCHTKKYSPVIKDERTFIEPETIFKLDRLNSKMCKVLPHLYLPNYKYTIWVDANIEFKINPIDLLDLMEDKSCLVFTHPERKTINEEIKATAHLDSSEKRGFHQNKPGLLAACGVIVRRNDNVTNSLNEKWWAEICKGSHRDQLSFPYTLGTIARYLEVNWKIPYENEYIKVIYD